jgi:hypothetical protein
MKLFFIWCLMFVPMYVHICICSYTEIWSLSWQWNLVALEWKSIFVNIFLGRSTGFVPWSGISGQAVLLRRCLISRNSLLCTALKIISFFLSTFGNKRKRLHRNFSLVRSIILPKSIRVCMYVHLANKLHTSFWNYSVVCTYMCVAAILCSYLSTYNYISFRVTRWLPSNFFSKLIHT